MNYFECCHHCVAPKRYPGCSGKCPDYAEAKAKFDADRAKQKSVIDMRCYIGGKLASNLDAAAKNAKRHRKHIRK